VLIDRNPKSALSTKEIYFPPMPDPEDPDAPKVDPETQARFVIKKATNREDIARLNMFSKTRYVPPEDEEGAWVTERDYPMGDYQVGIIYLCLTDWNLSINGQKAPITRNTIQDLMTVEERLYVFDEIMELNPSWQGNAKNS
jgi:hypothetical protein